MNQEALRFRYYSRRRAVDTPFDRPDHIEAVVDAYGIDYIVTNRAGNYAPLANRYLADYFAEYGEHWTRLDPEAAFSVYVREGARLPR